MDKVGHTDSRMVLHKAGIVEPEETSIARQLLGKHIPAATNLQATIE
jgi:hypothetical protein